MDSSKSVEVFHGWREVSRDFRTTNGWKSEFRRVKRGEVPQAFIEFEEQIHSRGTTVSFPRRFKLFHITQTTAVKPTKRTRAIRDLWKLFTTGCRRKIKKKPLKGWWTLNAPLSFVEFQEHVNGTQTFGVYGDKSGYFIGLDLDWHPEQGNSLILFLKRLTVLLEHFHSNGRCHIQVELNNATGVHLYFIGPKASFERRARWMKGELKKLEAFHGLGLSKIEVKPATSALRLPLSKGRVLLLDEPTKDPIKYLGWISKPVFMAKADIIRVVVENLTTSVVLVEKAAGEITSKCKSQPGLSTQKGTPSSLPLRGRTRPAIVSYWRGDLTQFPNLNSAIIVTLRALFHEGLPLDRAQMFVGELVSRLPAIATTRTKDEVQADINRMAKRVWFGTSNQPNSLDSDRTWAAVTQHWARLGFKVSDPATWTTGSPTVDFPEGFDQLVINDVAPILVGHKQATKAAKQAACVNATRSFIRFVKGHPREIALSMLPKLFAPFDVKLKRHDKQVLLMKRLCSMNLLYVRAKPGPNRATAYGLGTFFYNQPQSTN